MRLGILTGSALALAVLTMGCAQAAACDDDCDYCGGYGNYAASYGYYARPAYGYVPGPYYAAPAYAYYAPAYSYYAPAPTYYAPPPAFGYPYGRPYYDVEASAAARHRGVPGASAPERGMYALGAKPGPQLAKAPNPGHVAPAAVKAHSRNPMPRGVVAAPAKPPKLGFDAPSTFASAAKHGKPEAKPPIASHGSQPKYLPTYYGDSGGYVGQRR